MFYLHLPGHHATKPYHINNILLSTFSVPAKLGDQGQEEKHSLWDYCLSLEMRASQMNVA